ncbi:MAG: pantoate--beta-alanine ligase [Candidatus Margulisbacteria bacterium]|jgi:pantoate--beta-alanine ligase|nr:pantoate--beta-alanine ligase [Candidatus Margulisiibacteriota bacterium]
MMLCLQTAAELAQKIEEYKQAGLTIGFVPTMGYLHDGHLALVSQSRQNCDVTVVSIFINPAQFGPNEDFAQYPRDLARDKVLLERAGADILFAPDTAEIYPPDNSVRQLRADARLSAVACGLTRPGHFDGVVTVVARLFDLARPDKAFFGRKDYQQLRIIQKMAEQEKYPVQISGCPVVREPDGLALSSRNKYLSAGQRKNALALSRSLTEAARLLRGGQAIAAARLCMQNILENTPEVKIDYLEFLRRPDLSRLTDYEPGNTVILGAVYVGATRLIDNIEV